MSAIEKLSQEFARLLEIDEASETIEYLFNIDDESDVREFLNAWIDVSKHENETFVEKLIVEWKRVIRQKSAGSAYTVYQKYEGEDTYFSGKQETKKGKKAKQKALTAISIQAFEGKSTQPQPSEQLVNEKKKKYVPLFSQKGEERSVIRLSGRHICNCQAHKHKLINNCLQCGRIVCEQEGSGPCTFCGSLVCTKEEREILDRHSKKSEKLLSYLLNQSTTATTIQPPSIPTELSSIGASISIKPERDGLANAVKNKERLLEYDRNCVKRTQIIDDECDYFSMDANPWLTKEEKSKLKKREEELYEKRYGSRQDKKITIDFAGRRIIEEGMNVNMYDSSDDVVQEVYQGVKQKNNERHLTEDDFAPLLHPNMPVEPPRFVDEYGVHKRSYVAAVTEPEDRRRTLRIQDAALMEMSDQGKCLSMHQPWASLLVAGIKMHEGRTWYTTHRGRLWIASTMKEAYQEDIDLMKAHYRASLGDNALFPDFYPRSCLLGCVEVVDCLAQQEYREQYPDGDSDSPYVMLCRNPHELSIKFPVQGQHKIYRLDAQTHKAAKLGVMRDAKRRQNQEAET